jgi:hypothetical protein
MMAANTQRDEPSGGRQQTGDFKLGVDGKSRRDRVRRRTFTGDFPGPYQNGHPHIKSASKTVPAKTLRATVPAWASTSREQGGSIAGLTL